jgi:hypothetical protein
MQPTLAWLDFNTAERERTQRVLALFEEREASNSALETRTCDWSRLLYRTHHRTR